MNLNQSTASIFIPDDVPESEAISRTTHLGIGAHHDDLEFMALHGIISCFGRDDRWFGGITCADGAGGIRSGRYSTFTNEEMIILRREEQINAARIGEYGFMAQLAYPSAEIRQSPRKNLVEDLSAIMLTARPECVYTHNPADRHDTHIAAAVAVIEAIRSMPPETRPSRVLGCEVWRGLDWMIDEDKTTLDVSGHDKLAETLIKQFASQIEGGKNYDLAVDGRRRANATFSSPYSPDSAEKAWFAMDLTPLAENDELDPVQFTLDHVDRFRDDVETRLRKAVDKR